MHTLNGKHIPYALNNDDGEIDDNDSDDVCYSDDDGNADDYNDDFHNHHSCHQCHHFP